MLIKVEGLLLKSRRVARTTMLVLFLLPDLCVSKFADCPFGVHMLPLHSHALHSAPWEEAPPLVFEQPQPKYTHIHDAKLARDGQVLLARPGWHPVTMIYEHSCWSAQLWWLTSLLA